MLESSYLPLSSMKSLTEVSNISVISVSSNCTTFTTNNDAVSLLTAKHHSPVLKDVLNKKRSTLYKGNLKNPSFLSYSSSTLSPLSMPSLGEDFHLDYNDQLLSSSYDSIPSLTQDSLSISSFVKSNDSDKSSHNLLNCDFNVENHPLSIELEEYDVFPSEREELFEEISSETSFFRSIKNKVKQSSFLKSAKSLYNKRIETLDLVPDRDLILHDELPLETFCTTYKQIDDNSHLNSNDLFINIPRQRECRINPNFLKFYSIDSSIRIKYSDQLLCENMIDYYQNQFKASNCSTVDEFILKNFNNNDDNNFKLLVKYSLLSRDKMWSNVILKPRTDTFTIEQNTSSMFIKIKNDSTKDGSLIRENGKMMPWCNLNDCTTLNKRCFKPKGVLPNNVQYTVKNWENKRWSSCY